jgi:hypothetical protein
MEATMKKFLVLYMAPLSAMQQAMKVTPEEGKRQMAEWMQWGERHKDSIVDMGAPLGKTKRVTSAGAADAHNEFGGYGIMQGESAEAVANIFVGHPHLRMDKDARIEIIEIVPMTDM